MCKKKKLLRNNYTKNVNINVQWMQFPNPKYKIIRDVNMLLKSISHKCPRPNRYTIYG